jgi:hypothetical protein
MIPPIISFGPSRHSQIFYIRLGSRGSNSARVGLWQIQFVRLGVNRQRYRKMQIGEDKARDRPSSKSANQLLEYCLSNRIGIRHAWISWDTCAGASKPTRPSLDASV